MPELLSFGGRTLHASPRQVLSFTDFSFAQSVKTDKEDVNQKEQVTAESVSTGKISLGVPLLAALGVEPLAEFSAWRGMLEEGVQDRLYVAGQPVNEQLWMLKEVALDSLMVNTRGVAYEAQMRVSFEGQTPQEEAVQAAGSGSGGGGGGGGTRSFAFPMTFTMGTDGNVRITRVIRGSGGPVSQFQSSLRASITLKRREEGSTE